MPGNYPTSTDDCKVHIFFSLTAADSTIATSSGGYGATHDKIWSNRSQRGVDMPLGTQERGSEPPGTGNDMGLAGQSVDGTNLKNEKQDATQGWDKGSAEQDVWGIEKGAEKDF